MFGRLKRLMPTRSALEAKTSGALVADLDALIEQPTFFKLHGKIHKINPMLVEEFWAVANALADLHKVQKADKIAFDDMVDNFHRVIHAVCPSITRDDLRSCTQAQLAAIMQRVNDHVNGVAQGDEKKKTLLNPR